jgi:hypothetical protein
MLDTTRSALRALLPDVNDAEIQAAEERLRRYFQLALDIARAADEDHSEAALTRSSQGGNVNPGKVDPTRTLTNTG